MNNNLKHLVEQAGISVNIETDHYQKDMGKWIDCFAEKFSELLVKECGFIIQSELARDGNSDDSWDRGYMMGMLSASNHIAEHFRPTENFESDTSAEFDDIPF